MQRLPSLPDRLPACPPARLPACPPACPSPCLPPCLFHPQPTAALDFMAVRRAYTVLSSAELRAEYETKMGLVRAGGWMAGGRGAAAWHRVGSACGRERCV